MSDDQTTFVDINESCSFPLNKSEQKHHWQRYVNGSLAHMPEYLARNYWWAYLSPIGVSFFDHPFIVNRILWGQYHAIARDTVNILADQPIQSMAEISCAYGEIIPLVGTESNAEKIYLFDVAPIQLRQAEKKIKQSQCEEKFCIFQADAESIPLDDNSVDTSLLFFLMHELPEDVCNRVQAEALRITRPGGRIIIADYGCFTSSHWFHRMSIFRAIFETLEPFLGAFWRRDLLAEFEQASVKCNKQVELTHQQAYWHKFYRLWSLDVS